MRAPDTRQGCNSLAIMGCEPDPLLWIAVGGSCSSPDIQSALRAAAVDHAVSPSTSDAAAHNPFHRSSALSSTHQHPRPEQAANSPPPQGTKPQSAASDSPQEQSGPDASASAPEPQPPRLHKEISLAQQLLSTALPPAESDSGRQPTLDPVLEGSDSPPSAEGRGAVLPPPNDSPQDVLTPQLSLDKLALTEAAQDASAEGFSAPDISTPQRPPSAALPKVASVDLMPRTGRLLDDMHAAARREAVSDEPPATRASGRASRPLPDGAAAVPSRLSMVSRAVEAPAGNGAEQPAGTLPAKAESRGEAPVPPAQLPDGPEPAAARSVVADSPQAAHELPPQVASQHQVPTPLHIKLWPPLLARPEWVGESQRSNVIAYS